VIAMLAFVGSSVSAWAAAGVIGEPTCCCPVKTACKCHDHDDGPSVPTLKKCGGEAKLVAPAFVHAAIPDPIAVVTEATVATVIPLTPDGVPDAPTYEPETPPF